MSKPKRKRREMSIDNEVKHAAGSSITIAVQAGTSVVKALRDFLNAFYLAQLAHGDSVYYNVLHGKRHYGSQFKKESSLEELNLLSKDSRTMKIGIHDEDRKFIQRECKKMNVNYFLAKRPANLEQLYQEFVSEPGSVTGKDGELLDKFLLKEPRLDEHGNLVLNKRGLPIMDLKIGADRKPVLIDAEHLLAFAECDIPKWEYICRKLEARNRTHVPLKQKLQTLKINALRTQREHETSTRDAKISKSSQKRSTGKEVSR